MRNMILLLGILLLAACSTQAASSTIMSIEYTQTDAECRPEFVIINDVINGVINDGEMVSMTASDACTENTNIPFAIINEAGSTVYDGGVYAGGTPSTWITRVGVFRVEHRQTGVRIATITITQDATEVTSK